MVDVVSRRCDSPGCKRQPSGTTDATHVQFCSLHRGDGRAGYTLLMLAQRERIAAAAALEETQKQQRARAPLAGSWPGKEMTFSDYRPRWETTSSASSAGGAGFSGGQPAPPGATGTFASNPSSSGSFLSSQRSGSAGSAGFSGESFLSNQRRGGEGSSATSDQGGASSQEGGPQPAHNPQPWVWTAQPRGNSQGGRRPPPIKNPAETSVLGSAGRQSPPLDSARGDSPGAEWTKPSSTQSAHAMYPAVKRHCSPRRRSFSHSPEPGSRSMIGLTGSMAGLQASSPASPGMGPIMGLTAATGTPSPSSGMGLPTPPGSSSSAALPPPHGAPRRSAQRFPQPQFQNRAMPRTTGGPPRPPRSLSPGGLGTARGSSDGFYPLPGAGRSPVSGVAFSPSGPPTASPGGGGGFSGVFSPGSGLGSAASGGGGLNSARSSVSSTGPSPRWASPRHRAFGHTRTRSQGSVADTLEDLSIVDPGPPTLEPLRVFPAAGPLRSPRDRWRGGLPERRNSEIILPLPDRTQPDPAPGPSSDGRRRSFTASLFDQQPPGSQPRPRPAGGREESMEVAEGGAGVVAAAAGGGGAGGAEGGAAGAGAVGVAGGGPGPGPGPVPGTGANGALASGEGSDVAGSRWGSGVWSAGAAAGAGAGDGGGFQTMPPAGYRQQQGWPQHIQTGGGGGAGGADDQADATHVEAKETRRGSHMSVGTLPLTSSESLGDGEGGVFFSAEA